jgi:hypothetical protein
VPRVFRSFRNPTRDILEAALKAKIAGLSDPDYAVYLAALSPAEARAIGHLGLLRPRENEPIQ